MAQNQRCSESTFPVNWSNGRGQENSQANDWSGSRTRDTAAWRSSGWGSSGWGSEWGTSNSGNDRGPTGGRDEGRGGNAWGSATGNRNDRGGGSAQESKLDCRDGFRTNDGWGARKSFPNGNGGANSTAANSGWGCDRSSVAHPDRDGWSSGGWGSKRGPSEIDSAGAGGGSGWGSRRDNARVDAIPALAAARSGRSEAPSVFQGDAPRLGQERGSDKSMAESQPIMASPWQTDARQERPEPPKDANGTDMKAGAQGGGRNGSGGDVRGGTQTATNPSREPSLRRGWKQFKIPHKLYEDQNMFFTGKIQKAWNSNVFYWHRRHGIRMEKQIETESASSDSDNSDDFSDDEQVSCRYCCLKKCITGKNPKKHCMRNCMIAYKNYAAHFGEGTHSNATSAECLALRTREDQAAVLGEDARDVYNPAAGARQRVANSRTRIESKNFVNDTRLVHDMYKGVQQEVKEVKQKLEETSKKFEETQAMIDQKDQKIAEMAQTCSEKERQMLQELNEQEEIAKSKHRDAMREFEIRKELEKRKWEQQMEKERRKLQEQHERDLHLRQDEKAQIVMEHSQDREQKLELEKLNNQLQKAIDAEQEQHEATKASLEEREYHLKTMQVVQSTQKPQLDGVNEFVKRNWFGDTADNTCSPWWLFTKETKQKIKELKRQRQATPLDDMAKLEQLSAALDGLKTFPLGGPPDQGNKTPSIVKFEDDPAVKEAYTSHFQQYTRTTGLSQEHTVELTEILKRKLGRDDFAIMRWLSMLENLVADKIFELEDGEYKGRHVKVPMTEQRRQQLEQQFRNLPPDAREKALRRQEKEKPEQFMPSKKVCVEHGKDIKSCAACQEGEKPVRITLNREDRHIQLLLRDFRGKDGERVAELVQKGYEDIKCKGERSCQILCHPTERNTGDLAEFRRELTCAEKVGVTVHLLRERISDLDANIKDLRDTEASQAVIINELQAAAKDQKITIDKLRKRLAEVPTGAESGSKRRRQ